jgi:hypothetical protein
LNFNLFVFYDSLISLRRLIVDLTVAAVAVDTEYAPPATVFLHALHVHMPTTPLRTLSLPQNVHVYFACCVISIFLICLRNEAPYRVPYLPTTPTYMLQFEWYVIDYESIERNEIKGMNVRCETL